MGTISNHIFTCASKEMIPVVGTSGFFLTPNLESRDIILAKRTHF